MIDTFGDSLLSEVAFPSLRSGLSPSMSLRIPRRIPSNTREKDTEDEVEVQYQH